MNETEKLLNEAADNGTFLGEGKPVKGAMYQAFTYNEKIFVGVFTSDNLEYLCGAEEITKDCLSKYIII